MEDKLFYTSKLIIEEQASRIESPRGKLLIASCRAGSYTASKVVKRYKELSTLAGEDIEVAYLEGVDFQFSDSETCVKLDKDVSGHDVFLFQALQDPVSDCTVDQNYLTLLIAAETFKKWGANSVTAIIPYLAYSRQDKPTKFKREPTTAQLFANLSIKSGIDRLVTWHPHSQQIQGFYGNVPVDQLDSLPLFVREFRRFRGHDEVIAVSPDAGASKYVTYFSRELGIKSAVASKFRPRPGKASITEIIGDFAKKKIAIILDDMISSGGTVYEVVKKLVEEKEIESVYLGVSHNLCMESAWTRLQELQSKYCLKEIIVTDSIQQTEKFHLLANFTVKSLADILSRVINRIHFNREVTELQKFF